MVYPVGLMSLGDVACLIKPIYSVLCALTWRPMPAAACSRLCSGIHLPEALCQRRSTLNGSFLKIEDKFTYLGSSVSSTETDINTWLEKAWTVIDKLSVIWKSDLTDKIKCSFFHAAVVSILLYSCTTWTLTKRMEKKLDGNYTRMLQAILNKF